MELFEQSVCFGVVVSLGAYGLGCLLQRRFHLALLNPLLISIAATILILVVAHVDYDVYYDGAKYLSFLLTPATVCLAVPLYEKLELLKQNWKAILAGILSGVLTTLVSVLAMSVLFHLSHAEYVTLLPKSITTAIGMGVSQELGGYVTLTVAVIIITGILGNVLAPLVPCPGNRQGHGDGGGGGGHEQPVHCGLRPADRGGGLCVCPIFVILPYRSGAHFAPGAVFLHGGDQIIPAWEREKSVPGADMQKNSGKSSVLERFWNGLAHFEEQCRAYNTLKRGAAASLRRYNYVFRRYCKNHCPAHRLRLR